MKVTFDGESEEAQENPGDPHFETRCKIRQARLDDMVIFLGPQNIL
jgi:hypothetical protein